MFSTCNQRQIASIVVAENIGRHEILAFEKKRGEIIGTTCRKRQNQLKV